MLYEAILLGSDTFHATEGLGRHYDEYFRDEGLALVERPERLDEGRAARLITFVNQWRTRYQATPTQLAGALRTVLPDLCALRDETLLTVDLTRRSDGVATVADVVERAFDTVARCGRRYESTGASKILHMVHPRLFVMWDNAIAAGYAAAYLGVGQSLKKAADYAHAFLPLVQLVALRAVKEHESTRSAPIDEAVATLTACGHTLAKVIDEYNYVKFTLRSPEL